MKLYSLALLLGFYCSQTRGDSDSHEAGACCETGFCYGNLYIPIITILCLALLLSIAVNVYYLCMRKYRVSCQNCYDDHIDVCCCCDSTNACDRPDDETQAVSVSSEIIECEDHADKRAVDCVYSAVKVNVKAPADTRHSATSDSSGIRHCEDHHSDTRHSSASADTHHSSGIQNCDDRSDTGHPMMSDYTEIWESEDQADESTVDCLYSNVKC